MSDKAMQEAIQRTAKEWTGRLDIPSNYTGQLMEFCTDVATKYAVNITKPESELHIGVFYQKLDEPFITSIQGPCSVDAITDIERDLVENASDFFNESGDYVFNATDTLELKKIGFTPLIVEGKPS